MTRITMRATRAAIACAFLPFAIAAPQAACASPHDPALGKIWADFGLGYGYMSGGTSAPADSDGGGVWLDAQLGGRLSSEWLVGFNLSGAGKVLYDNKSLEAVSGNQRSGNGNGGIARVGYDWPLKNRTHVEASLSYELGNISLNAPFTGSFHYSVIALAAHFSYH